MFMKSLLILFISVFLWNNIVKAQPPCINGHINTDLSASLSAGLYYIDTDVYVTSDITITDAELLVIGNVVFLSQNLYNAITNEHRIFTTSCEIRSTEFPDSFVTNNYVAKPANKIIENNTLSVYPNPVNNNVTVKGNDIAYIEVYTIYGIKAYSSQHYNYKGAAVINLPLKNLAQGMYILKVYDRQNKSLSRKLIKQ